MEALIWIVTAAAVFGLCRLVDKGFQKLFRNKAEHLSGQAVRVNKRYGAFGVILSAVGVAAIVTGAGSDRVLFCGGIIVLLLGLSLGSITWALAFSTGLTASWCPPCSKKAPLIPTAPLWARSSTSSPAATSWWNCSWKTEKP